MLSEDVQSQHFIGYSVLLILLLMLGGGVILTAAQWHKNNNSTEISNDVRYKTLQLKITHKIKIIKAKEKQHNTYYYVYVLYILPWYRFLLIR